MKNLANKVIGAWGQAGEQWLQQLPLIVDRLATHWSLNAIEPVANLSFNYVARAIQHGNQPVVLKISCDPELIESEYTGLQHFDATGSIRVLDRHVADNALLLEQAIPGTSLKALPMDQAIMPFAKVASQLTTLPTPTKYTTHARDWCEALDRITDSRIQSDWLNKAKQLRDILFSSAEKEYLCHGDLHLDNIIQHGDSWLSIDPKGVMGELAFEAAAFDLPDDNPEQIAIELANALQLDKNRLLGWMFLRIIISAQWFVEDNGDPSRMLALADKLYTMVNT